MRRIKLFENFNGITEEEIRGALVELRDNGYDILVNKTSYDFDTRKYLLNSKNGYTISITAGDNYFYIKNVSESILDLIYYFTEKYGDRFVYSIEFQDSSIEFQDSFGILDISELEEFIKSNPSEDTTAVIIILRVN